MKNERTKEDFKYFMEKCTKGIAPDFTFLLDYNDPEYIQSIYDKLMQDKAFIEYNSSKQAKSMYSNALSSYINFLFAKKYFGKQHIKSLSLNFCSSNLTYHPYLTAIKSKPFLLLAGISGTGKSRIVREFAFKSCPKCLQDKAGTTPGNYCMIEVKPNWHDSTELLGYYSNLNKEHQFTKFVKFLVKAKMFPKVPFFVCLDEMNLAPVE